MIRLSRHRTTSQAMYVGFAIVLVIVLLGLAPFASALEIHHELAAADHDGHEHSASDLCKWVQHHTGFSVLSIVPPLVSFHVFAPLAHPASDLELSTRLIFAGASRAPPHFSLPYFS